MRIIGAAGFISTLIVVGCSTGGSTGGSGGSVGTSEGGSGTTTGGTSTGMGGASATGGSTSSSTGGTGSSTGGATTGTGGSIGTTTGGSTTATGGTATAAGGSTAKGGSTATGGSSTTSGGSTTTSGGSTATGGTTTTTGGAPATGGLVDRITTSDVTVPAGVKAGVSNYRVWGSFKLKIAPVYTAPRANCGTLVCYTTGTTTANARVARLGADDKLVDTLDLGAGLECRGIASEPDGHFAALLWDNAADKIYVKRYDVAGAAGFSTELTNSDNHPTDFGLGESRLEFGAGKYGAYYHVHSDSGHEGDTLKFVAADTGATIMQGSWTWGCSHSMSDLLSFSPTANAFLPVCVTDCYPGTGTGDFPAVSQGGIFISNTLSKKILDVDAGCNGSVAGELGGAAVAAAGWKVVYNAHQNPMTLGDKSYDSKSMNQDIGFASVGANQTPGAKLWLTTTPANEADSTIARWEPSGDAQEQYVVGWLEGAVYKLSRVDAAGAFLEGPTDVTAKAKWGQRDDPFRPHVNKDVVWAWFDAAGATTFHFARLRAGGSATCAAF